jgi:hypothetical protein
MLKADAQGTNVNCNGSLVNLLLVIFVRSREARITIEFITKIASSIFRSVQSKASTHKWRSSGGFGLVLHANMVIH